MPTRVTRILYHRESKGGRNRGRVPHNPPREAAMTPALAVFSTFLALGLSGTEADRAALLAVDVEFSAAAQQAGIAEAFVRFADPEATMLPANEQPVTGLDGIRAQFANLAPGTTLVWKPFKSEAAASGDLG